MGPPDPNPPDFTGEKWVNCFLLLWALLCFGFVGIVWGELLEGVGQSVGRVSFQQKTRAGKAVVLVKCL